jgi:methyl-accepting chemotaxis protein
MSLLLGAVIIPMVSITMIVTYFLTRIGEDNYYSYMSILTGTVDKTVSLFIEQAEKNAGMLADNPVIRSADSTLPTFYHKTEPTLLSSAYSTGREKRIFDELSLMSRYHPEYVEVYLGTRYHALVSSESYYLDGGYDPVKRPWYQLAQENEGIVSITGAFASTVGQVAICVTQVVYDFSGEVLGAIGIEVSLDQLTDFVNRLQLGATGSIMLVGEDGTILTYSKNPEMNFQKLSDVVDGDLSLLDEMISGIKNVKINGVPYLALVHTSNKLGWKVIGLQEYSEIMKYTSNVTRNLFYFTIFFSILFISLAFGLSRGLTMPLLKTTQALKELTSGNCDLTQRVTVISNDEVGELAVEFNHYLDNMQQMVIDIIEIKDDLITNIREIAKISDALNHTSTVALDQLNSVVKSTNEILANTRVIASSTEKTFQVVNNVAESTHIASDEINDATATSKDMNRHVAYISHEVDKVSKNVADITTRINDVISSVQESALVMEQMSISISEVSRNTTSASKLSSEADIQAANTNTVMHYLTNAAKEIGKILKVINDIANQTNLLSLNASIEMANATGGSQVFSVLAKEAKHLAKQTGNETERISLQIEDIQKAIIDAVAAINNISGIIHSLSMINNVIATNVQEQSSTISGINDSVFYVIANARHVSDYLRTINDSTEHINVNVSEAQREVETIVKNYDHIASLATDISMHSSEANTGMEEIAKNTANINLGISAISDNLLSLEQACRQFSCEAINLNQSSASLVDLSEKWDALIKSYNVK